MTQHGSVDWSIANTPYRNFTSNLYFQSWKTNKYDLGEVKENEIQRHIYASGTERQNVVKIILSNPSATNEKMK